ncbi:MAG: hypothetical protein LBQ27_03020 [Clostridiales bacterium]|jgi:hypothetical protein|nr:hypothetical protein [Clostridiales bacterium]
MDINKLTELLSAEVKNLGENKKVETGYCGDFLSFAMSRAPSQSAWFTVMSNVNVAAVSLLADVSVIVLCENVIPDDALLNRCVSEGLSVICTKYSAYEAAGMLFVAMKNEEKYCLPER